MKKKELLFLTNAAERSPKELQHLGKEVPNLCAITAAMKYGTGLNFFYRAIPERF